MLSGQDSAERRARQYALEAGVNLVRPLGAGYDGSVYETNRDTALKALEFERLYQRERDVYLRLYERDRTEVCGCSIPRLVDFDDRLWVVEMEIVQPPFVLDFAGAYLDARPEYPPEVWEDWENEKREQFGDDWPLVRRIMSTLAHDGIWLADVKPGNITLH